MVYNKETVERTLARCADAEAVGEFLYNEDGKETGHAPLDMPEKLGEKIIVTI